MPVLIERAFKIQLISRQQDGVGLLLDAGLFGEALKEVGLGKAAFFLAGDVEDDAASVHHDKAVAVADGVCHVVRYH